jgi:hypothetical protein
MNAKSSIWHGDEIATAGLRGEVRDRIRSRSIISLEANFVRMNYCDDELNPILHAA